jgi:sulfotransferase
MRTFIMLSGIPRSGSQVLASLLNQHPMIHSSTTSPVVDMVDIINKQWPQISAALTDPPAEQYPNMLAGMINGAYDHIYKPVIVDKNRIWPRYGQLMTQVLRSRPKIICTVRSIPEVLASYIILIGKNGHKTTYIDQDLIDLKLPINTKNRCRILWEKYIYQPYTSLRIGYNAKDADLCFVTYDEIVSTPAATMDKLTSFIGIPTCDIASDSMQPMPENDAYHGGLEGLHDVRAVLKRASPPPEKVIGHELVKQYTDMRLEFWR